MSKELPKDRLTTTDESGRRVYLYPADVRGRFRDARNYFYGILLLIFLVLPWIKVGGIQSILLDLPRRRFSFFGLTFWGHDAPLFWPVLAGFVMTLVFSTAVWGRIWCGWACPQTVFIDGVFRRIERWIEGDAFTRRKRDAGPWTPEKIRKKAVKGAAFVLASLVISHSFLAYFVGTDELAAMVRQSPVAHPTSFLIMLITTGIVLFDFGWFREQFCAIACPYGRFQSVLMDDHSMIVGYDSQRGEPRSGSGDCVNCYRCVQVCPTGVDIRRGVQMECVACSACIDACDEVMTRLHKPVGLIRYTSFAELQGQPRKRFGVRARVYLAILSAMLIAFVFMVSNRKSLDYTFVRFKGMPFEMVNNAAGLPVVLNHYKIDLSNQSAEDMEISFDLAASAQGKGIELVTPMNPVTVSPGVTFRTDVFIRFPRELLEAGSARLPVEIHTKNRGEGKLSEDVKYEEVLRLVGPF